MSTLNVTTIQHESASGNNIVLDSDGNVEIAGEFESSGKIIGNRDSGTSDCFSAQLNGTANAIIRADGRIRIGGTVGSSPNIDLSPDGNVTATGHLRSNPVPGAGNYVEVDYTDGIQIVTENILKTELKNDGTAKFLGKVNVGDSDNVITESNSLIIQNSSDSSGTNASIYVRQWSNTGRNIIGVSKAGAATFEVFGNGDIEGNLTRVSNVQLKLDPDNPDSWQTKEESYEEQITGPLGKVEKTVTKTREVREYIGKTLDVRSELQALRARATQQDAVIAQMVTALRSQGVTIDTTEVKE